MKRVGQTILKIIFGEVALYCYFTLSILGLFGLSVYQIKKDYVSVPSGVQPEFHKYVRNFIKESRKYSLPKEFNERMEHLTVKFGFPSRLNDEHDFVGWCELNTTTIIIEKDTWNTYAEGSRQNLIDHELGHCILERNHRPYLAEGKHPISVMFPQVLPSKYYDENKDRLYPELFDSKHANWIRDEITLLNQTWNEEKLAFFKSVPEYLRFIESEMYRDQYQPWPEKKKEAPKQVIQFDTAEVIIANPKKRSRQDK